MTVKRKYICNVCEGAVEFDTFAIPHFYLFSRCWPTSSDTADTTLCPHCAAVVEEFINIPSKLAKNDHGREAAIAGMKEVIRLLINPHQAQFDIDVKPRYDRNGKQTNKEEWDAWRQKKEIEWLESRKKRLGSSDLAVQIGHQQTNQTGQTS